MRAIGYSTGALARGNVSAALAMQRTLERATAVELSALRLSELDPLLESLPHLELDHYRHVSVHAPSRFTAMEEQGLVERLVRLPLDWPVIVHPDTLHDVDLWRLLGGRMVLENMDARKGGGRTADELQPFFETLPEAGFCLDLAHALHVDRTGGELRVLLDSYGGRLVQLHVSSVSDEGEHGALDHAASHSLAAVLPLIPSGAAVILESVVSQAALSNELDRVGEILGV